MADMSVSFITGSVVCNLSSVDRWPKMQCHLHQQQVSLNDSETMKQTDTHTQTDRHKQTGV